MGSSSSKSKEVKGKKSKVKNGKVVPVQEESGEEPVVEVTTKKGKAKQNKKKPAKADKKKNGKKQEKHKADEEVHCDDPSVTELGTERDNVAEQNGKKVAKKNDKKKGKAKQKKHVKDTGVEQPVVEPCAKEDKVDKKGKGSEQNCEEASEETDKKPPKVMPKKCKEENNSNSKNDKIEQKDCKPTKQKDQLIIAYADENCDNDKREQERERGGSPHQTQVDAGRKPKITNGHLDVVEGHQALEMEIAEHIRTLKQEKISVTVNLPVLDLGQVTSDDDNDSTDDGLSYDGYGGIRYEKSISFEDTPAVSKLRHLNKHRAPMQQKRKPARFSRPGLEDQVQEVLSAKPPQKLRKDKKGGHGKEKKKEKQKVKKTRSISDPNSVVVV